MEFCKISSVQNSFMVPKNAFPAFKAVALAGKHAARINVNTVFSSSCGKSSKWWISMKSLENIENPETAGAILHIAATFPASATGLNAGNAFFGTLKRFCTEEILPNFI